MTPPGVVVAFGRSYDDPSPTPLSLSLDYVQDVHSANTRVGDWHWSIPHVAVKSATSEMCPIIDDGKW